MLAPRALGAAVASIHRAAEKAHSRKLSFRCREFSETQPVALVITGNPICRANPIRSGLRLCTNARTTFRYTGFSETQFPTSLILGNPIPPVASASPLRSALQLTSTQYFRDAPTRWAVLSP